MVKLSQDFLGLMDILKIPRSQAELRGLIFTLTEPAGSIILAVQGIYILPK
jgi:hypothetical protein